jgi:L-iditol 2-dehydrogenase
MTAIKLARALGAGKIIATDMSRFRLRKALEYGADRAVAASENIGEVVREVNGGRLADQVIIAAGSRGAALSALGCVAEGGLVLFFAVPLPGETVPIDFNPFWRDDITIKTCYGAAPLDNMSALELIANGTVKVDDMITHRFGIDRIQQAFETGSAPDSCLKVIVEPNK